jgi:hypothetical protein
MIPVKQIELSRVAVLLLYNKLDPDRNIYLDIIYIDYFHIYHILTVV